jgi:hypothetical protein
MAAAGVASGKLATLAMSACASATTVTAAGQKTAGILQPARDTEKAMSGRFEDRKVGNGELVLTQDMPDALTAATLHFPDGATQVFTADGKTTYVEQGRSSDGEWSVIDDGELSSFWPPSYRATYALRWIVEAGEVAGLSFTHEETAERFDGRYE